MPNHAYHATAAPGVVQRARSTKTGRRLERGGYLTVETVTMWIVYALTLVGNAVIEGGQVGGNTSATVASVSYTHLAGSAFVTSSIPPHSRVSLKAQEITVRQPGERD